METQKTDRRGCPPGQGVVEAVGRQFGAGGQPGRIGNPPHVPTDETRQLVRTYAKVMSQQMIAASFEPEISVDTLQRHYRRELDAGKREAVATVGGRLLAKALAGNLTAMIFYLRTQGGWSAKLELGAIGGGPLRAIDLTSFLADKNEEECEHIEQVLNALAAAGGIDVSRVLGVGDQPGQGEAGQPQAGADQTGRG